MTEKMKVSPTPEWIECFKQLEKPTVSELETNGKDSFFIKEKGKRRKLPISVRTNEEYIEGIRRSLIPLVKNFNDWDPVEGYIFEGPLLIKTRDQTIRGRTHIVLPPATDTPQITIAKKSTSLVTLDDISERGSMSTEMMIFLKSMIAGRRTIVLSGGTGAGKSLTHDTKIFTPDGWTTMGKIKVGDKVYGSSGEVGEVLKKFPQPAREVYRFIFNTNETFECDLEHNWLVNVDGGDDEVKTTAEIIDLLKKDKRVSVKKLQQPIRYENMLGVNDYALHPYVFGYQLSTGSVEESVVYSDTIVAERMNTVFETLGLDVEMVHLEGRAWKLHYHKGAELIRRTLPNDYEKNVVRQEQKVLPHSYMISNIEARKLLLSGLFDGQNPNNNGNVYTYESFNHEFLDQIANLVASFGMVPTVEFADGGRKKITVASDVPFTLLNLDGWVQTVDVVDFREVVSVEAAERVEEMSCITVTTEDSTYLIGDTLVPTHNTTMLEALAKFIPMDTRIGIAEDTPELQLPHGNASYLHSVPWAPGMDPNKVATLDWCVAQFNRMRTDMLIIGETRGKEFASFLVAANSGMEGCMTTIHANDAQMCLKKMTNFAQKGNEGVSARGVNTDIANAVDLIVQLMILPDGRHRVASITEVTKTVGNDDTAQITTNTLYEYDRKTDTFMKNAQPTDTLRNELLDRGVDIVKICNLPIGVSQKPHTGKNQNEGDFYTQKPANRSIGLPTGKGSVPRKI